VKLVGSCVTVMVVVLFCSVLVGVLNVLVLRRSCCLLVYSQRRVVHRSNSVQCSYLYCRLWAIWYVRLKPPIPAYLLGGALTVLNDHYACDVRIPYKL
jgi:hypothetical protein